MTCERCIKGRMFNEDGEARCLMCGYAGPPPALAAYLVEAVESARAERSARGRVRRKPLQGAALVSHQARLGRAA